MRPLPARCLTALCSLALAACGPSSEAPEAVPVHPEAARLCASASVLAENASTKVRDCGGIFDVGSAFAERVVATLVPTGTSCASASVPVGCNDDVLLHGERVRVNC